MTNREATKLVLFATMIKFGRGPIRSSEFMEFRDNILAEAGHDLEDHRVFVFSNSSLYIKQDDTYIYINITEAGIDLIKETDDETRARSV